MSRAHVQGFDSNPAQFERMGNPWVSERERAEYSAPSRKEARQNRNPRKAVDLGNFPNPDYDRGSSPNFNAIKRRRDFVALALSRIGGSRTVTPTVARENVIPPTELQPLTSEQLELRRQQRDAVQARLEAGEAAYRASEAYRIAERKRLEGIRAAIERKLAKL